MIDLTPLDVRNKRGDFRKLMRGYDPQEVDLFLEIVAERLEGLVRENIQMRERTQTLQQQVTSQLGREQAVQDALVTAQELRADIKAQSQREAEHLLKEAQAEARRMIAQAEGEVRDRVRGVERRTDGAKDTLAELERRRTRFLKEFRQLLEREMDVVEVEEGRAPLEERAIDLDLGPSARATQAGARAQDRPRPAPDAPPQPTPSPSSPTAERAGRSASSAHDELAASFEAEAVAQAQARAVEVTGTRAGDLSTVPRLEEVLAEAGAELADHASDVAPRGARDLHEIAPPPARGRGDDTLLLYLDSDEPTS